MITKQAPGGVELPDEVAEKAFSENDEEAQEALAEAPEAPDEAAEQGPPDWAVIPKGVKLPAEGVAVAFIRIPAGFTAYPSRGDRVCACWPITETEERLALARSRGDSTRAVSEMAKQTIRVIDGHRTDWTGKLNVAGSAQRFWSEIGPKGRQLIRNYYIRTHQVTDEEALDFFSKHYVSTTVRPA